MSYLVVILSALLVVSGLVSGWQYDRYNDLVASSSTEIAGLTVSLNSYKKKVAELEKSIAEGNDKFNDLYRNGIETTLELKAAQTQLSEYKHRESVVLRKPGLVQLKANKATKKLFSEITCVTGRCEEVE